MTGKVTFLAIDKWREYLEYTIGRKLRERFARNKGASIPPVTFYTPQQARAARLPETGWYDYSERRIGIVINPERNPKREWVWATLAVVHECLHWLFNHSPILVDITQPLERHIMNIFRDASNEQRGLLEFAWSRHIIRRGRRVILDEYFAARTGGQCSTGSPVYEAAIFTLVAHTLLAARGFHLLRQLYSGKAASMAVWAVLEPVIGPPPAAIANEWQQAFELAVRGWKERNEFDRADLVREFIALFPHSDAADQPPESPVDIGGHIGEETPVSGDPPGAASLPDQQNSRRGGRNEPGQDGENSRARGSGDDQSEGESEAANENTGETSISDAVDHHSGESEQADNRSGDSDSDGQSEGNSSEKTSASSGSSNAAPDEGSSESAHGGGGEFPMPLALDLDDPDDANLSDGKFGDGANAQDDPRAIEADLKDLNREAECWVPGAAPDETGDRVFPADPRDLINRARNYAAELATQLRISERPEIRGRSKRGRVLVRVVARHPDASDPFSQKKGVLKRFGPGSFIAVLLDSSGSMSNGSKWPAAQLAAMAAHLACDQANVPHVILMSRTLKQLAGVGLASTRSKVLIAGASHAPSGDHYTVTLPKALKKIARRDEPVKIVVVITDGTPYNLQLLKQQVEQARKQGMIVVGVGLDLNAVEVSGMKVIFGDEDVVIAHSDTCGKDSFAATLGQTITAAVTRGKRAVCHSFLI
jgi:hypothetical protein